MRVRDLIEKLLEMDQELPVCVYDRCDDKVEVLDIWVTEGKYTDENDTLQEGKHVLI